MDLTLSSEQLEMQQTVRDLFAEKSAPDVVRAMEEDKIGYDAELWSALADVGVLGLLIPDELGGLGFGWEEAVLVFEEAGRVLVPGPLFETAVLAASLLENSPDEIQRKWLPRIASGDATFGIGWKEPGRGPSTKGIGSTLAQAESGLTVSGSKVGVSYANSVDRVVVLARSEQHDERIDLVLIDPKADGVTLNRVETLGSTPQFMMHMKDVPVSERLSLEEDGWQQWQTALLRSRVALGAWSIGVAARALEMATDYAREREQFGRPIGGFQGVAHPLATVAKDVTSTRLLVQQSAWAIDSGRPYESLAAMVGMRAPDIGRTATKVGHQTLGGIGFTNDLDMQLYYRRAKEKQLQWQDHRGLSDVIVDTVIG